MRRAKAPTRVAMIGAGRLARALLPLLAPAGYRVSAVASAHLASARAAARLAAGARATTRPRSVLRDAEIVLLAVPDRMIERVARELSAAPRVDWSQRIVLHHAGAWGTDLLRALGRRGAGIGVFHPMQCLGQADIAARVLPASVARIEGDARGLAAAHRLSLALGLVPVVLPSDHAEQRRADYHAAAALVGNDLVALIDVARELLLRAGLDDAVARQAMTALARGSLAHYAEAGEASAITGPVSRGDAGTLQAHLDRLSGIDGAAEIHCLLSRRLATMVRRHGAAAAARAVERALASGRPRSRGV